MCGSQNVQADDAGCVEVRAFILLSRVVAFLASWPAFLISSNLSDSSAMSSHGKTLPIPVSFHRDTDPALARRPRQPQAGTGHGSSGGRRKGVV